MSKKIIGITLAGLAGISGAFAGGMFLSNSIKDENYSVIIAEKQEDIDSIASNVENLNDIISSKDSEISLLKVDKNNLQSQIENLKNTISEKDNLIVEKNALILELEDDKENNLEEIVQLNADILALQTEKSNLQSQLNNINSEITELENRITQKETEYSQLQTLYNNIQIELAELQASYESLITENTADKNAISSLNSQISSLQSQIEELEEQLNSEKSSILDFYENGSAINVFKVNENCFLSIINSKLCSSINGSSFENVAFSEDSVSNSFSGELSSSFTRLLSNGDVILFGRTTFGGIGIYNPTLNNFKVLISNTGDTVENFIDFGDGYFWCSSNSSYAEKAYLMCPDYSFTEFAYKSCYLTAENEKFVYFTGRRISDDVRVMLRYDRLSHTVEELVGDSLTNNSLKFNYSFDDGSLLASSYGAGGLYYFDAEGKSFILLNDKLWYTQYYFKISNGLVLMNGTSAFGLYSFDKETKTLNQIENSSSFRDMDLFSEENGIVVIKSSKYPTYEYHYDIETGILTKIS